jgi:hypothetical protein
VRPFPWLTMVRHLNRILRAIHGPAYKKTYRILYVGSSRLKKNRRVYRIPTLKEAAQAKDQPQTAEVVPLRQP